VYLLCEVDVVGGLGVGDGVYFDWLLLLCYIMMVCVVLVFCYVGCDWCLLRVVVVF